MKIEEDKIFFDESTSIICPYQIEDYVTLKDIVIVLLKIPLKVVDNRNVIAYNSKGQLWQIDNLFNVEDCPYNMIKFDESGLLHLYNWCGFIIKLNPYTGEVVDKIFSK